MRKEVVLRQTERTLFDCYKRAIKELKLIDHSKSLRVFNIIDLNTGKTIADTLLTFRCLSGDIKSKQIDKYLRLASLCEDQKEREKYSNKASKLAYS